ncbi:MAG: hypothetical protein HZA78_11135 [Candidatus Schekmanbacteria bacterium]|nr:hypothetical protein [Candidatus Schekmanbacteria bacterium]
MRKCGREPGGNKTDESGICPAATDSSSDGLNSGKNAGRLCWAVVGTLCNGEVQSDAARKMGTCVICDVFQKVKAEENPKKFVLTKPEDKSKDPN